MIDDDWLFSFFFFPFVQLSHFRAASITFLQMLDKRRWGAWCPGHEGVDCSIMCSNWSHRCLGKNCTHNLQVEKETHDSSIMFSRIVFDIYIYIDMFECLLIINWKLKWPSQLWGGSYVSITTFTGFPRLFFMLTRLMRSHLRTWSTAPLPWPVEWSNLPRWIWEDLLQYMYKCFGCFGVWKHHFL